MLLNFATASFSANFIAYTMKQLICLFVFEIVFIQLQALLGLAQGNGTNTTNDLTQQSEFNAKVFGLAFGLAHIPLFAGIAVAVVIGVYCCYRWRKKRGRADLAAIAEKGGLIVLDDNLLRAKEEGRLTVNVSVLENGKSSEPNDYSKQNENGNMTTVNSHTSPDKKLHARNQDLPPIPDATNPLSLTNDGYSMHEEPNNDVVKLGEISSDGYTLLTKEGDESNDTGYIEVNEQDAEMDGGLCVPGGGVGRKTEEDEHDYEEPYWEPASKEEELMHQLSQLNVPVIPAKNIEIRKHLGSGQFGTVNSGMWKKSESNYEIDDLQEVAVKSMKEGASEEERIKFLQEATIMGQFKNPYILEILGYMTGDPLKIVVEIMGKGDLRQHLISLRPDNSQPVCKDLGAILLSYTRQIALGMGYLSIKQYVHRDLAARNVLVSDEGVCKIADFGLSRNLQHEDYYISHGGKIPVKWTAPEALHYRKYSTASDVWSYGCLLYEIWSLGYKPFHDITNAEAMPKIASGYRLPPPPGCPRSIYQLMIKCWHPSPSSRPAFSETVVMLQHPDFQILKWTEKDIATINETARTLASPLEEGHCLYLDLQNAYKLTPSNRHESDRPQKSNLVETTMQTSVTTEPFNTCDNYD